MTSKNIPVLFISIVAFAANADGGSYYGNFSFSSVGPEKSACFTTRHSAHRRVLGANKEANRQWNSQLSKYTHDFLIDVESNCRCESISSTMMSCSVGWKATMIPRITSDDPNDKNFAFHNPILLSNTSYALSPSRDEACEAARNLRDEHLNAKSVINYQDYRIVKLFEQKKISIEISQCNCDNRDGATPWQCFVEYRIKNLQP